MVWGKNQLFGKLGLVGLTMLLSVPTQGAESSGWLSTSVAILETSATVFAQKSYSFRSSPVHFVQRYAITPLDQYGILATQQTLFSTRLSPGAKLTFSMNTQTAGGKVELKLAL